MTVVPPTLEPAVLLSSGFESGWRGIDVSGVSRTAGSSCSNSRADSSPSVDLSVTIIEEKLVSVVELRST